MNLCKDYHRKRKLHNRKREELAAEWEPFTEEQQLVFNTLRDLPLKYKIVIYLYYYEGYSIPEISAILKSNEKTVFSQLSRGREKLKQLLIKGGYDNV